VAINQEKKTYIQVAYLIADEKNHDCEFGNLLAVPDNCTKIVVSMDETAIGNFKEIIEITVVPHTTPISYKGHYYIRSGTTVQELKGSNLQQFLLAKANVTWDEINCEQVTADNFDINTTE